MTFIHNHIIKEPRRKQPIIHAILEGLHRSKYMIKTSRLHAIHPKVPKVIVAQDAPESRHGLHENLLTRSEEHTSELQSRPHLVCRLLLEKKKKKTNRTKR